MSKINVVVGEPTNQDDIPVPSTPSIPSISSDDPDVSDQQTLVVPNTGGNIEGGNNGGSFNVTPLLILFVVVAIIFTLLLKKRKYSSDNKTGLRIRSKTKVVLATSFFGVIAIAIAFSNICIEKNNRDALATDGDYLEVVVDKSAEIVARPGKTNVFAIDYDTVRVVSNTEHGYSLSVYADSANLVSEENTDQYISGLNDDAGLSTLGDNTWGIGFGDSDNSSASLWYSVPDSKDTPFVIKNTYDSNDKTTNVYYGVNVTPDLPKGTYTGVVNYVAVANVSPDDPDMTDSSDNAMLHLDANGGSMTNTDIPCNSSSNTGSSEEEFLSCTVTFPLEKPVRDGYFFLGWDTDPEAIEATVQPGAEMELSFAKVYYAIWAPEYNLKYSLAGDLETSGGTCHPNRVNGACSLQISTVEPTRDNYQFSGWATSENSSISSYQAGDYITMSSNVTLYAVWNPAFIYRLIFHANTSSEVVSVPDNKTYGPTTDYVYRFSLNSSDVVSRADGVEFLGWCRLEDCSSGITYPISAFQDSDSYQIRIATSSLPTVDLYAAWEGQVDPTPTETTYTLSFDANGGSGVPGSINCATSSGVCSPITIPETIPTRSGYEFLGWSEAASASAPTVTESITISENTTLYAIWAPVYTLSYNLNGGTGNIANQTCYPNATFGSCSLTIASSAPTKSGYSFLGWAKTSGATKSEITSGKTGFALSGNTTLYAIWAPVYTLSYNLNGGTGNIANQTCYPNATSGSCSLTIASGTPTRSGYRFLGWATSSSVNPATSTETIISSGEKNYLLTKNTTLYAIWRSNSIQAVHFINLHDSGNATLLESNGKYALVDTGLSKSFNYIKSYLNNLNIKTLEFVIITHAHSDHAGGTQKLINNYTIKTIYRKSYSGNDSKEGSAYDGISSAASNKNICLVSIGYSLSSGYKLGSLNKYANVDNGRKITNSCNSGQASTDFVEDKSKSGVISLGNMKVYFFNTINRMKKDGTGTFFNEKTSDRDLKYFSSNNWGGNSENINSLVNLIRVNAGTNKEHSVLLPGDANNYSILSYIMDKKLDLIYNQNNGSGKLDVYSLAHHGNYNCTGNQPFSGNLVNTGNKMLDVRTNYYVATQDVDRKLRESNKYAITNDYIMYPNDDGSFTKYASCMKQMGIGLGGVYFSANKEKKVDGTSAPSKATVFDLTNATVSAPAGGIKGASLTDRRNYGD